MESKKIQQTSEYNKKEADSQIIGNKLVYSSGGWEGGGGGPGKGIRRYKINYKNKMK